jgi:leucyl aminopeptidase (aminopeptidase T)
MNNRKIRGKAKRKAAPRRAKPAPKPAKPSVRQVVAKKNTADKLLAASASIALETCMAVKPRETVLIVTDEPERKIGMALFEIARKMGNETILTEIIPRQSNGEEPPLSVAKLMGECQVVICVTSKSLTHTAARREACARGARVGTMPGITEDMMLRCMNADYQSIADRSKKLVEILEKGNELRVTSPAGTDFTLYRGNRRAHASTGLLPNPGDWGNLPSGETYFAPMEGTAQGVIVFDGSMAGIGKLKKPIEIVVRDGYAVEIKGGPEAEKLNSMVDKHGQAARNIAEFGIGTNDQAKISGLILEDEKVMGTVHIALGDNVSMGGSVSVQSHLDGLIKKPTVYLDGRVIMEKGEVVGLN